MIDTNDILLSYENYNINETCARIKPTVLINFVRPSMIYFDKYSKKV